MTFYNLQNSRKQPKCHIKLHNTRTSVNTLRPRQNGRHFADDIFKCMFLNENVWIPIKISLKFVPKGPINNIPALVQIMAWRRPGDKPLSEPMMVSLLTHICVTRPQWVNILRPDDADMRPWNMVCHQSSTKPLHEQMLTYFQWNHHEQTSVKGESKYNHFNSTKFIWKYRLQNVISIRSHSTC